VNGLDDIGITLKKESYIKEYERVRKERFSFLESGSREQVVNPVKGAKKSVFGGKDVQEW
jgi:3-isopropylmalate dehydratase